MTNVRFIELFDKNRSGVLSESEAIEWNGWIGQSDHFREMVERLHDEEYLKRTVKQLAKARLEDWQDILVKIPELRSEGAVVRHINKGRLIRKWIAVAAAILFVAFTTYWFFNNKTDDSKVAAVEDIRPGGEKALLTLADGSTIILDNAANGNVAQQGSTKIIKLDNGQLAYDAGRNTHRRVLSGDLLYNTISTPRGGQYQITLPDGTKVWLNAASSIKFPAVFSGTERNVDVTGEAYMEIAKNVKQPFRVKANGTEIQVLGTSFNINAYSDEEAIKTTLVEGSVKIKTSKEEVVLKPGEQAVINKDDNSSIQKLLVQADDALAWKNGIFNFTDISLKEAMRQLARWYDLEVVYKNDVSNIRFYGKLSRSLSLSELLEALKVTELHFSVDNNRKLVVSL
jgi:ferric-dicitrate binding protein FerR (iron transport regulator)